MKLGLYSESARSHIARIREKTADLREDLDEDRIREIRNEIACSDDADHCRAAKSRDFFTMSTCRDLLFHLQEHRFDFEKLGNHMSELGLHFCGMSAEDAYMGAFRRRFPEDLALTDLEKWSQFEEENPWIFGGMYFFWCQKI